MAIDTSEAPQAPEIVIPEGQKLCPGSPKHGLPAHVAPFEAFGKNAAYEDGFTRMCKADSNAYTKILRELKKQAPAVGAAETAEGETAEA